ENEHYNIDEKMRAATLTEEGIQKMEEMLGVENIYTERGMREVHHIEQALKAKVLFKKDKDYVVREGEIIIVDEFTGRLMFGRRYSDGLHQAIEAKENVEVKQESITMATVTFQNYFRMYKKLAGMTGTAATEGEEFSKIYNLDVIIIPTNKPVIRKDKNDVILKTEKEKYNAIVEEIKLRNELGQPVLVGTISIENNEHLSNLLQREGVEHQVLNAKHHEKESEIIAQAGRKGAVTIATNMAGRGVDIVLGGNPSAQAEQKEVKEIGGLMVLGTERHESRRIDNQLRGRAGRQGDPGSSQFFVSMEDDLMRIFGGEKMKSLMTTLGVPDGMPIENKMISRQIENAQRKVEGNNFDIRKHLVEYDDVINLQRETIYRKRNNILESRIKNLELRENILEHIKQEISGVVKFHTQSEDESSWNLEEIYEVMGTIFPAPLEVRIKIEEIKEQKTLEHLNTRTQDKIIEYLYGLSVEQYEKLEERINSDENLKAQLKSDEQTPMNVIEKMILLRSIDTLWVEHIDAIDSMRQGIGLRGYGQKDPLVEYKKEAHKMFQELLANIRKQVVYSIFKVSLSPPVYQSPINTTANKLPEFQKQEKVGRNDQCPCGSGKKYKKCCGK
ncbi:SEC-C domain-containing protein, partial [Candidatus Parcubacteria bacterium]|nr:SEC-C domain-containing protein [Candidatus Parcubacteria bacterium]